ncbi:MAG TPA: hypothetical protein VFQ82_00495 [Stellaceae bacterium]|jgi:hypothetical protein|nr:hypothetical protein [Stellaceae bacterium]
MRFSLGAAVAAAGFCVLTAGAQAAAVTLDFDEVSGLGTILDNFYNGGKDEIGEGPGPNFGITFRPNSRTIPLSSAFVTCADFACTPGNNVLKVFAGSPATSPGVTVHVAGGFRDIVEFDARMRPFTGLDVFVSDPSISGPIVHQSIFNTTDDAACETSIDNCPFVHYRIDFSDTGFFPPDILAHDLTFGTFLERDTADIDNLHFSDLTLPPEPPPTVVPEPASWIAMPSSLGLLGLALRLRRPRSGGGLSRVVAA